LANLIGPLIGASIEKRKGKSPVKGAILGSLVQSATRTAISLAATALAGVVLKSLYDKIAGAAEPAPASAPTKAGKGQ